MPYIAIYSLREGAGHAIRVLRHTKSPWSLVVGNTAINCNLTIRLGDVLNAIPQQAYKTSHLLPYFLPPS